MSINQLHILLDLNQDNKTKILDDIASKINLGYFFVDSEDGHCYLFDKNGNIDDINKIKILDEKYIKKDIEKIVIPDSIEIIETWAFFDCVHLISIDIPNSVKKIDSWTFKYCYDLKSIKIPNSVKSIEDSAFKFCKNLKSINIPDSIENIGKNVFCGCKSLTSIKFKGKTIDQVKSMENYPFGIKDESIIKCI